MIYFGSNHTYKRTDLPYCRIIPWSYLGMILISDIAPDGGRYLEEMQKYLIF